MADFPEQIRIEDWQVGLMTDPAATDIPPAAATLAENADLTSLGKIKKSRGPKTFGLPALPSGLTLEAFFEFRVSIPSEKDVTVIFGANGGRDRFYISPYWDDLTAAWVTSGWLELTEALLTTVETRSSNTDYTVASVTGLGTSNDYHNKWYIGVFSSADSFRGNDYALDYVASTRQIITKYGVSGTVVGDKVLLMRFPIFKNVSSALTPHYQIDSFPSFEKHGEHVYIYTGSHAIDSGPDLWLGFIGTASSVQGYFDDNDLDFRGFYLDMARPGVIDDSGWISSSSTPVETQNPLPYSATQDRWINKATWLLDGFQEGQLFYDINSFSGLTYTISDATSSITLTLSFNLTGYYLRTDRWPATPASNISTIFSRRISKLLLYVSRGQAGTPNSRPVTPYFMWKEIDIDDSGWSGTGPYTMSVTISGIEWDFAQKFPYEINAGHKIEKLGANAKYGEQVGGNFVVGPIYADQEYLDVLIVTPLSGTLVGKSIMPNVIPLSAWLRFRQEGIYDIIYWTQLSEDVLVAFGVNTIALAQIAGENSRISGKYKNPGLISARGVQVYNGVAYYPSSESIWAFNGTGEAVEIGARIRSDWQAISLANRQACFSGFNARLKQYFLKAGSTIFVYSIEQNNWKTDTLDKTWTYFAKGVDGEFLGTDGTDIFQIDASGYTVARALHWKSKHLDSARITPRRFRASYKSSDLITIKLYDVELDANIEMERIYLLPSTTEKHVDEPISFESNRILIDIQTASSTNDDTEIDYAALAGDARKPR